jgi:tetratricopeptide (TPR) repeat protein
MVGTTLENRYRLESLLGRGGMGAVYRARDLTLGRDVAVKVVEGSGLDAEARQRLLHEARAAAALNHPRVAAVHDAGESDGVPFIVMELVPGGSLRAHRHLELREVVEVGRQLCEALAHAHEKGIVHRDLKPENVLVASEGDRLTVKLADLGLAISKRDSRVTQTGAFLGTAAYMSPEQALGVPVDGRADLYALGALLYEQLTGRPPFPGDDAIAVVSQHLHAPVVPPVTHRPDLPPALDALVLKLLAKRPEDRFTSATEVEAALAAVSLTGTPPPAPAPETDSVRLLEQLARGRLVGRASELMQLREFWSRAERGQGHMVLVSGEPGVGKTRLAREMAVYARLQGAWVLQGGCYEFEATTPYLPFVEALRAWVRGRDPEKLRAALGATAPELSKLAPEIEVKLGQKPALPPLSPAEERLRLFDHVARFLAALAEERGLLLVLDDLHWADHGTLALLHYLLRQARESRLMVLGMYREAELDRAHPLQKSLVEWNRERMATRVPLGRLSLDDTAAMLAVMFGQDEVSLDFARALHRETEGNPFFVEEVVKALIEQGQIYRERGEWQRHDVGELAIPQSIKAAVSRRLERLTPACTEVLQTAAALGKIFEFQELVAATAVAENPLLDALDQASASQLIRVESGESFAFTHDKIREVLHEELNPIRQRRLHQRIGESLEKLYAQQLDDHVEDLAYHFARSGDLNKGLDYSKRAAAQAERLCAHQEALDFYGRARECAEILERTDELADIEEHMGDAWWASGESKPAIEHYRRAVAAGPSEDRRLSVLGKIGEVYGRIGDPQGLPILEEVRAKLDADRQPEDMARVIAMIGRYHHYRGQHRQAIEHLERALALAESAASLDLQGLVISYLAGAYQHLTSFRESDAWARREIELGERTSNWHTLAVGHEFMAENAAARGQWDDAIFHASRDREWGEKAQSQERIAWAEFSTGWALWNKGNLEEARAVSEAGLERADRIGEKRVSLFFRMTLAGVRGDLGLEGAAELAEDCLREAAALGLVHHQAEAHLSLALLDIQQGRWELVLERQGAAAAIIGGTEARMNPMRFAARRATALVKLERWDDAKEAIEDALERASVAEAPHFQALGKRAQALWCARTDRARALALLAEGIATFEALGSRLELGRTLVERGSLLAQEGDADLARADFQRAAELAKSCGAPLDLACAEGALRTLSGR